MFVNMLLTACREYCGCWQAVVHRLYISYKKL